MQGCRKPSTYLFIFFNSVPEKHNKVRHACTGYISFLQSVSQFSRSVMSDSLGPHGLQHARPHCPSPTPGIYSNSCPLSWWCHPTILSSVVPFSSCLQSFPASGPFVMRQLFRIRWLKYWSFSFSISLSDEYLRLISFSIKWFDPLIVQESQESSPTLQFQSISSIMFSLLYGPTLTYIHDYWKNHSFD